MNGESWQELKARREQVVARLRQLPNAAAVAREFGRPRSWVSRVAKAAGIDLTAKVIRYEREET